MKFEKLWQNNLLTQLNLYSTTSYKNIPMQDMCLPRKKAIHTENITNQGATGIASSAQTGFHTVESKYISGGFIAGKKKVL